MGDVDDGNALALELPDDPKEDGNFVARQGGGRFIHDEDLHVLDERLGNRHDLLRAHPEVPDFPVRVNAVLKAAEDLRCNLLLLLEVDDVARRDLPGKEHVVGNRHVGAQVKLLVDDPDPVGLRLNGSAETAQPCRPW